MQRETASRMTTKEVHKLTLFNLLSHHLLGFSTIFFQSSSSTDTKHYSEVINIYLRSQSRRLMHQIDLSYPVFVNKITTEPQMSVKSGLHEKSKNSQGEDLCKTTPGTPSIS